MAADVVALDAEADVGEMPGDGKGDGGAHARGKGQFHGQVSEWWMDCGKFFSRDRSLFKGLGNFC